MHKNQYRVMRNKGACPASKTPGLAGVLVNRIISTAHEMPYKVLSEYPVDNFGTVVGENPTPYGILALWAVNGLSIVYWVDM